MLKIAASNEVAVCVMLGVVTECYLIAECAVKSRYTHKISIAPFPQEMRRDTSLWGQLFEFSTISGPVSENGISFSTRFKTPGTTSGAVKASVH